MGQGQEGSSSKGQLRTERVHRKALEGRETETGKTVEERGVFNMGSAGKMPEEGHTLLPTH